MSAVSRVTSSFVSDRGGDSGAVAESVADFVIVASSLWLRHCDEVIALDSLEARSMI
jgi:hypothetical protein